MVLQVAFGGVAGSRNGPRVQSYEVQRAGGGGGTSTGKKTTLEARVRQRSLATKFSEGRLRVYRVS